MTQDYKPQTGSSYIDEGIFVLQDRDDAVVTVFAGENPPEEPFQDLIWNDIVNNVLMRYNEGVWEPMLEYGKHYVSEEKIQKEYQPLNENLNAYSKIEPKDLGFANTRFIPMSYFYLNNFFPDAKKSLALGKLGEKNRINTGDIQNKSIAKEQLNSNIITKPAFQIGDVIPSFNKGNKTGCVKLSTSSSITYTVGGVASNSTYKGDTYKNLYKFVWERLGTQIYSSLGVATNKSSSWDLDWSANKRLALPSPEVRVIININPSDATVSWRSDFRSGNTNVITGHIGDKITINVSRSGYAPGHATFTLIEDRTLSISLIPVSQITGGYTDKGAFISAKCTMTINPENTTYMYVWSLRFQKGFVPIPVRYDATAPDFVDWSLIEDCSNNVNLVNSGVNNHNTNGKWQNAIAEDLDNFMVWSHGTDNKALDMIKYTTSAMWGWPQGAGSHWQGSVFTNDFSFRTNGNHVDVYKKGNFFYRLQNIVQSNVDFSDSLVFPNQNTILSLKSNMTLFMKY